jgi:hypothetical protein
MKLQMTEIETTPNDKNHSLIYSLIAIYNSINIYYCNFLVL